MRWRTLGSGNQSRCNRDSEKFVARLVGHQDEVLFAHHVRLFRSDPVSDEASMFPRLIIIIAFVANQIVGGKLACQMEEVPGHGVAIPPAVRRSKMPIAARSELAGAGNIVPNAISGALAARYAGNGGTNAETSISYPTNEEELHGYRSERDGHTDRQ